MVTIRDKLAERNAGGPEFKYIPNRILVEVGDGISISEISKLDIEEARGRLDTRPVGGNVMSRVEDDLKRFNFNTKRLDNTGIIVAETDRLSDTLQSVKNSVDTFSDSVIKKINRLENNARNRSNVTILDGFRPGLFNFQDSNAEEFEAKLRNELVGDIYNPLTDAIEELSNVVSAQVSYSVNTPGPRNLGINPFDSKYDVTDESDAPNLGDVNKKIGVDKAWQIDTGEDVVIAIFDTSFCKDLVESDRVIDTFYGDDVDSAYAAPDEGHGTMTAYSAGGNAEDTKGNDPDTETDAPTLNYSGVAKDAELLLARLSNSSGQLVYTVEAWDWLANWIKSLDKPVISNHSYGVPVCSGRGMNLCDTIEASLSDALSKRDDHQAVYAAGNEAQYCGHRLSGITNGIAGVNSKSSSLSIGAFRYDIGRAQSYSSHGFGTCGSQLDNPKPDVGTAIPTIVPYGCTEKNMSTGTGGSSAGTSEAAPITAGVAALIASVTGNARQSVIEGILESTAERVRRTQVNVVRGHDARFGNGQINAKKAVEQAQLLQEQEAPNAVFTYAPAQPTVGDDVSFDATGSTDPNSDIELYEWAFGDGTTATGRSVSHTFEEGGEYTTTLRVTDSVNNESTFSREVYVNSPPRAEITVDNRSPTTGESIQLSARNTSDPDSDIASYNWNLGDGTELTGETVEHTYEESNQYVVSLNVIDELGNTNTATTQIRVTAAPTASFQFGPDNPATGEEIIFDAGSSTDSDDDITSYAWDFGDGTTSAGSVVTHSYESFGEYDVTLTVEDSAGNRSTTTGQVQVTSPPISSFTYDPQTPTTDDIVVFDASRSSDPDGNIISYRWQFGDGQTGRGESVEHVFNNPQQFNVQLTVEDQDGNIDTSTESIAIGASPVAEFSYSPSNPNPSDVIEFDASDTTDKDNNIESYQWSITTSDGLELTDQGQTTSYQYDSSGEYNVRLTVTDIDGNVDVEEKSIKVTSPPNAEFTYNPESITTSDAVTFDASMSTDSDNDIESYSWMIEGDATGVTGRVVNHMFSAPGQYSVELTVKDSAGNSDTTEDIVTVRETTGDPGGGTGYGENQGGEGEFRTIEEYMEVVQVD